MNDAVPAGTMRHCRLKLAIFPCFIAIGIGSAIPSEARADVQYSRDVRPILAANCFPCHGIDSQSRKGNLRLDTFDGATTDRGGYQAIKPGDPTASELIRRITQPDLSQRMPPPSTNKTLTENQIDTLRRWITQGGRYEEHWAFVPPVAAAIPDIHQIVASFARTDRPSASLQDWPRNPIDCFILARLIDAGLTPSAEADRYALVRRLYLDLVGFAPTPDEADEYVHDASPDAYEHLVDRLLASSHYGERWARRWLDLARYADTNGYEKDRPRSVWPFRDWVIRALNADLSYTQFTIEQLAGDMLPSATLDQWIATGFHRNTMLNEEGGIDPLEFRFHAMTDRVATTGTTWLGLTLGCAQCHTHKYDPILHREYYQLMALLNNADEPDLDLPSSEWENEFAERRRQADKIVAELPDKWPVSDPTPSDARAIADRRREAMDAAFCQWLDRERKRTVEWLDLRPVSATSNSPLLTIQTDNSIFASGDITKDDTYVLNFVHVPAGTTAIRLEAMPDERLPAHGPGMTYYEGPKGDFFLGEFQVFSGDRQLTIARASESYARNNFDKKPVSAMLATDGDPQTGWTCAGRFGEPHQAVFVLDEPYAGGDLKVTLRFGRHYACSLGRFRISVTSSPTGAEARDLNREIESFVGSPDERLTAEQRQQLRVQFLLSAPELAEWTKQVRELRQPPAVTVSLVMRERPPDNSRRTFRHHRGEFLQPKESVDPGVPSVLMTAGAQNPQSRLEFARWLVSRDNPLTARVVVNRQWASFFGTGIVRTQADFGTQGEFPSHPELLDWLAVDFMDNDWSLKRLHRMIVCSASYRQSSRQSSDAAERDPQNRLLSHASRIRLDAESIRDAALRTSGLLSDAMFGAPVRPPQPDGVTEVAYGGGKWETSSGADRYRRGIYTFLKRTAPFAMFTTFDAPSGELCLAQREASNTPLQSLTLLNDPAFVEAAQALGRSVALDPGTDSDKTLRMFRRCVTRPPSSGELERLLRFVCEQRGRLDRSELDNAALVGGESGAELDTAVWVALARALLNLDEFITRD